MNLTPAEHTALRDTGEARVVREMEHQPNRFDMFDNPYRWWFDDNGELDGQEMIESPFPPAGTREVIDGIPCVWGESGCRQRDLFEKASATHSREWVWVGHIRKEERA